MANHPERNVVIWELASEEKNLTSGSESFCSFSTTGSTADLTVLEGKEQKHNRKRSIMHLQLSCSTIYNIHALDHHCGRCMCFGSIEFHKMMVCKSQEQGKLLEEISHIREVLY